MDMSLTLTTDMALVLGLLGFTVLMLVLEWIRTFRRRPDAWSATSRSPSSA